MTNVDRLIEAREHFDRLLAMKPVLPAPIARKLADIGRTLGIGDLELLTGLCLPIGAFSIANPGLTPITPTMRVEDGAGRLWDVAFEAPKVTLIGNMHELLQHVSPPSSDE